MIAAAKGRRGRQKSKPAVELLPYQVKSFKDRSRFKALMWARGARKTFTVTLEIVDDCFAAEVAGKRTTWVILSRGERQAIEAVAEARRHCEAYLMLYDDVVSEFVSEDGLRRYTQHELRFPCGSRIISLPANPDTARGYTANLFLDEFCIHEKDVEIWRAILPVLRGRFRVIVSSTPKGGRDRKFYAIINDTSGIWSKHIVDIYDAVKAGLPFDIATERQAMADPDGWAQEFELKWIDEASRWLGLSLIQSCEHELAGLPGEYGNGPCFVGNDIARHRDRWVAWVLEQVGDILWTREVAILHGATFAEQDKELDRIFERYRVTRLCMDKTGMGEKPFEDAALRYGAYRVEGVGFTTQSKYAMAVRGRQLFEDRGWRIPIDSEVRNDFHKLKKVVALSGAPRFDAASDSTGHADRAWAAFLAAEAAGSGHVDIEFDAEGDSEADDEALAGWM